MKNLLMLALATMVLSAHAEPEYFGCVLPEEGKESTIFLFLYDETPKGLLDGDTGILAAWPYGKVPHKCGVAPVYDLTTKDEAKPSLGKQTSALQFTCQRLSVSGEGASMSTITFMFDRASKTLWNAVYSDVQISKQVKDGYIASSTPESRRFMCDKLDPSKFKKPVPPAEQKEEKP